MLQVSKISKSYGLDAVLTNISFIVNAGERVGLVGPNGCGKTTLLRIITGLEEPDSGSVRFDPPGLSVGYLAQALVFAPGETVAEALARATADHSRAWADMQHYAALMASSDTDMFALANAYAEAESRFEAAGGYDLEARLETVLTGLDLAAVPRDLPVERLSGGQKTRLGLAGLLIQQPGLLLLDEPTNHLDIDALTWLEDWLRHYRGAALVVSHDRTFLDHIVAFILELDLAAHKIRQYTGNYSDYIEQKEAEQERQFQAYQDQQAEIRRMEQDIARVKAQAVHTERQASSIRIGGPEFKIKGYKTYQQSIAKKVAKKAKSREKKLERYLESDERVEKPKSFWQMKLEFTPPEHRSRDVLAMEKLAVGYPGFPPLLTELNLSVRGGERIVITGPNGVGKTTLLRVIAGQLLPLAGQVRLGPAVKIGYMSQEQEILEADLTPYDTIRRVAALDETETRRFLHFFLFTGDEVFTRVGDLSFGERSRLMLALLVAQGCNFLLLDEPINHLDIPSRERFERALLSFPGTMLAVVHDRTFIRQVATGVWEMRAGRVFPRPLDEEITPPDIGVKGGGKLPKIPN